MKKKLAAIAESMAIIALIVTAQAQAPFTPPEIIIYTERQAYKRGDSVAILGIVVDEEFKPVPDITISIIVVNPENTIVLDIETKTNQSGMFAAAYSIGQNAPEGEYLITAQDQEGEFTPGTRSFIVCNICVTKPQVVIVTTTLPGPTTTVTSILTTTVPTVKTTTATIKTTIATGSTSSSDLLTTIFIILLVALFAALMIAIRKYS